MSTTDSPEIVNPEDMNKGACATYLRRHNAFGGHSRSSLDTLREAVAAHQRVAAAMVAGPDEDVTAILVPSTAEREVATDTRDRHAEVPDPATDPAWQAHPAPSGHDAPQASDDRIERLALAKAEHKALQSWVKAGKDGDRPSTPNLDAMNADYAAGTRTSKSPGRSKAPAEVQTPGLRFHRRGTPMTDGQNRLSCVAYQATAGLGPEGRKLSVVELKALLKDRYGIDRPSSSAWEVTFDNGITAGATLPPER